MKKSFLIIISAFFIALALGLYHFYESIPVDKTIQISFISSNEHKIERTSLMKVRGKYHKNLLRPDTFFLNIEIDGKEYTVSNVIVNSWKFDLEALKAKLRGQPIGTFLAEQKDGKVRNCGSIEFYSGCTKARGVVNSEMFVGPVSSYDEAEKILSEH